MKITFLGTGEAFDPKRYNTAYLLEGDGYSIQVDAGYNVFDSLCKKLGGTRELLKKPDMLLLTHRHGDHVASVTKELMTMWEECLITGSQREIILAGEASAIGDTPHRVDNDYPGFWEKMKKEGPQVKFNYIYPHTGVDYNSLKINCAPTQHSVPNYAYRFDGKDFSFAISGDGAMTPQSRKLFEGVKFLVHEGFYIGRPSDQSHASVDDVFDYAKSAGITEVAIVHMSRYHRDTKKLTGYAKKCLDEGVLLWFPRDNAIREF